jgi:hypothetical protein
MPEEKTTTESGAPAGRTGCFFCNTVKPTLENIWSQATRDHFRNSRVEFLKGIRSIIDSRIEHLSRGHQAGTHVTVE